MSTTTHVLLTWLKEIWTLLQAVRSAVTGITLPSSLKQLTNSKLQLGDGKTAASKKQFVYLMLALYS